MTEIGKLRIVIDNQKPGGSGGSGGKGPQSPRRHAARIRLQRELKDLDRIALDAKRPDPTPPFTLLISTLAGLCAAGLLIAVGIAAGVF